MSRTKIKQLGANRQEIHLSDGRTILFVSYETVVAGRVPILDKESNQFIDTYLRTEFNHSRTTQKHITMWLEGVEAEKRSQDFFDKLLPLVG
tara:strand:+ start:68 stop:343 length:276 start_codon:yes stop_codon:yes gene_type:complete